VSPSERCVRLLATAVLAGLLGVLRAAAAPIDIVDDCVAKSPVEVSGIKDLAAACPGLETALQALGLDRMLYDGWREHLNRDSLRDAAALRESYRGSMPSTRPTVSSLGGILDSIAREQVRVPESWWDTFTAWLRAWFERHDADPLSWLDHWLERIQQSPTLLHFILYSLIGLALILAVWVVVNELKAAGVGGGRNPPVRARDLRRPDSGDIAEPVAPADQLSALLRSLVRRLMNAGRLKAERALTHRELILGSSFDSESQRAAFAAVAATAESALYGREGVPSEHLGAVLRQGHALLAELPDSPSLR